MRVPLALNEGRLLEVLWDDISQRLPVAEAQEVITNLRSNLVSEFEPPVQLEMLHSMVKNCTRCSDLKPDPQMPGWNRTDPDVLLVGEVPGYPKDSVSTLVHGLREAGFSPTVLCLTYVNRCPVAARKHTEEEKENCFSYLTAEIELMKPSLIVPLGAVATSVLCGTQVQLGEERGKVIWMGPWAILPTYSPTYVVRSNTDSIRTNFIHDLQDAHRFVNGT